MTSGVSAQIRGLGNNSRVWQLCWMGIFLLFGYQITCAAGKVVWSSVEDFVEEQSVLIRDLSKAVEERIKNAESSPNNWTCGCAYHDCGGYFQGQGRTCYDLEAPLEESFCPRSKVGCSPTLLSPDFSFVQVPPQIKPNELEEHRIGKHAAILNDICVLEGLEKEGNPGPYARAKKEDPSSGWAFAGSINGVFWLWPGRVRNGREPGRKSECPSYDPRFRSWYYPAISPPKVLIFIVDTAVMSDAGETIDKHLLTLGYKDLVSIIPFNSSMPTHTNVQKINEEPYELWNASLENSISAREANKWPPTVDVKSAFSLAFNLTGDGFVDSLDKFFVLISGSPLKSNKRKELFESVQDWQPTKNWAIILSYTMASERYGTEPDRDFAKEIACLNRGVWTDIKDPDEPDLSSYLFFLALPYEFQTAHQASAFFGPVYKAATYLGDVVSVSMGYHRTCGTSSPGPRRVLLGVVGSATRVSDLKSPKEEYENFQQNQELKGMSIRNVEDLECQLQWIRGRSNLQCNGGNACTGHNECRERGGMVYNKGQHVFCNWVQEPDLQVHTDSSFCCSKAESDNVCGTKKKKNLGIILLLAVGVPFVSMVLVLCLVAYRKFSWKKNPKVLGEGSGGRVYRCKLDGKQVALKEFKSAQDAQHERKTHERLPSHPNIVLNLTTRKKSIRGIPTERCLVMELMEKDLDAFVNDPDRSSALRYKDLLSIFIDITKGLEHLHAEKVIHRDLKPKNVLIRLVDGHPIAKIADFGHSRQYISNSLNMSRAGSPGFMSPEVQQAFYGVGRGGVQVGFPADIYSLGVTMCYCLVGDACFASYNWGIPPQMSGLIERCRHWDPTMRPTAGEVHKELVAMMVTPLASVRVIRSQTS